MAGTLVSGHPHNTHEGNTNALSSNQGTEEKSERSATVIVGQLGSTVNLGRSADGGEFAER